MWYPVKVTVEPTVEPVTVDEAKRQVIVDFDDDNIYLAELIASARDHVELYCGQSFAEKIVEAQCTDWCDLNRLPFAPAEIVDVTYTDVDGNSALLDDLVVLGDAVQPPTGGWPPRQNGSLITVVADVGALPTPPSVKHAIRLWVASAYEVRETAPANGRTAFDDLLTNHRR